MLIKGGQPMRSFRLMPRSIAAQITSLLLLSVLLGVGLTAAALVHFYRTASSPWSFETLAAVRAARIASIVREAQAARSPTDLAAVIHAAHRERLDVQILSTAQLASAPRSRWRPDSMLPSIADALEHDWGITPASGAISAAGASSIAVPIDAGRALLFPDVVPALARRLIAGGMVIAIAVITCGILLLSVYAVRWVTAPLSRIAAAARAFGRQPSQSQVLPEQGPLEIAQLAGALNEMSERIRALVDERTRMLLAISHDLRTPLTRLSLRVERVPDTALREGMQHDISMIIDMLTETLTYLREGAHGEPLRRVDLPSLLRTLCAEFSDMGHAVSYEGPGRLAVTCREGALVRAVSNVVDNATRHGKTVMVGARMLCAHTAQIEVSDDGPGLPVELREKVLEPFFKAQPSRQEAGRAGFGLGLSIARDILRAHDGDILLAGNERGGLTVQLRFRTDGEPATDRARKADAATRAPPSG